MNKVILLLIFSILTTTSMAQKKIKQTAGRDQLGTFAPKFAELNDDILFGEVWSRTEQHEAHHTQQLIRIFTPHSSVKE